MGIRGRRNFVLLISFASAVLGADLAALRGIVHDPQHRPLENAEITIRGGTPAWTKTAQTNPSGEFQVDDVPAGQYTISVNAEGFEELEERIMVTAGKTPDCTCKWRSLS